MRVCVRALEEKRLELTTPNLTDIIVHGSRSACVDPEIKRSKVKVTRLLNALLAWGCMSVNDFQLYLYDESEFGNFETNLRAASEKRITIFLSPAA